MVLHMFATKKFSPYR